MSSDRDVAAKAELIQSVKALFIPLSLFLACVGMAAGAFLVYNSEPLGWVFLAVSGGTVIAAFVALITFQNKYRAKGMIRSEIDDSPGGHATGSSTNSFNAFKRSDDALVFDPECIGFGSAVVAAPPRTPLLK